MLLLGVLRSGLALPSLRTAHQLPTSSYSSSSSRRLIHYSKIMMMAAAKDSENYNLAQDPSELFDTYPAPPTLEQFNSIISPDWGANFFPSPQATGKVKERSQVHRDGDWHRSIHVWIYQKSEDATNNSTRVLLQRRSPYKDTHPNLLDVSCAGHVNAGDDVAETTMREMEEELGYNGVMNGRYSIEDVKNSRMFTVTSAIEGETERHGKYICREYQDVFILQWKGDSMETSDFAPMVKEEVAGFELIDGQQLIHKLRIRDEDFVPRSSQYIDALENVFGC